MTLFPNSTQPEDAGERIVAIVATARDANRAMIRVGSGRGKGKVVATLTSRLVADLDLHTNQPWTPELAKQVESAKGFDKAMRAAVNRLNRRPMSRKMVDDKLRELDHSPEVREAVLDRLAEVGLLDDEVYGRSLIRAEMSRKAAGPRLLSQKLYQKGIAGELAARLIEEATSDRDEQLQSCLELARKKMRTMQRLDATTRKRRLYGQLARRGFDTDTIRAAMEAVEQDEIE